jgi:hypothetical protein
MCGQSTLIVSALLRCGPQNPMVGGSRSPDDRGVEGTVSQASRRASHLLVQKFYGHDATSGETANGLDLEARAGATRALVVE